MRERRLLWVLLGLGLARGLLYTLLVPLWQNPDELGHFEYAKLVAEGDRARLELPLRETTAYRVLAALGHRDPPPGEGTTHADIRRAIAESLARHRFWEIRPAVDPRAPFAHSELGQPPLYYLGAGLLLRGLRLGGVDAEAYALRVLDVLLAVGVVGLTGLVGRELFPGRPLLALAPAALVTFLPQYTSLAAAITNDRLVDLLFAGAFLLGARAIRRGRSARRGLGLGALALAGVLTKTTGLFLGPILFSLWDVQRALRRGTPWGRYALTRGLLVVLLAAGLVASPRWLPAAERAVETARRAFPGPARDAADALAQAIRRHFGASLSVSLRDRFVAPLPGPVQLRRYFAVLFSGLWGNFGHMEAPLPLWLYGGLAGACGVAGLGLARAALAACRARPAGPRWRQAAGVFFGAAVLWVGLLIFLRDGLVNSFSQGRYLYPVLVPLAVLFVVGLRRALPRVDDRRLLAGLVLALALVDAIAVVQTVIPFFYGVALVGIP